MKHSDEICYYCDAVGIEKCPLRKPFPLPSFKSGGVVLPSEKIVFLDNSNTIPNSQLERLRNQKMTFNNLSNIKNVSIKNPKIRGKKVNLRVMDDIFKDDILNRVKNCEGFHKKKSIRWLRKMRKKLGEISFEREYLVDDINEE